MKIQWLKDKIQDLIVRRYGDLAGERNEGRKKWKEKNESPRTH